MNIFLLDDKVDKIAEYYADQHVWNGLNDIPTMLACAYPIEMLLSQECEEVTSTPFREQVLNKNISNDICCRWAREGTGNFIFLINLWKKLEMQSILRFNAGRHRYLKFIQWCQTTYPEINISEETKFEGCFSLGSEARMLKDNGVDDIVYLYRHYYSEKKHLRWKNKKPDFL